jgi:hypothetical protein
LIAGLTCHSDVDRLVTHVGDFVPCRALVGLAIHYFFSFLIAFLHHVPWELTASDAHWAFTVPAFRVFGVSFTFLLV